MICKSNIREGAPVFLCPLISQGVPVNSWIQPTLSSLSSTKPPVIVKLELLTFSPPIYFSIQTPGLWQGLSLSLQQRGGAGPNLKLHGGLFIAPHCHKYGMSDQYFGFSPCIVQSLTLPRSLQITMGCLLYCHILFPSFFFNDVRKWKNKEVGRVQLPYLALRRCLHHFEEFMITLQKCPCVNFPAEHATDEKE